MINISPTVQTRNERNLLSHVTTGSSAHCIINVNRSLLAVKKNNYHYFNYIYIYIYIRSTVAILSLVLKFCIKFGIKGFPVLNLLSKLQHPPPRVFFQSINKFCSRDLYFPKDCCLFFSDNKPNQLFVLILQSWLQPNSQSAPLLLLSIPRAIHLRLVKVKYLSRVN